MMDIARARLYNKFCALVLITDTRGAQRESRDTLAEVRGSLARSSNALAILFDD